MIKEIEEAIKLLHENGYAVKKITRAMEVDSRRCEEMSCKGEDMDCLECACSVCVFNGQ